MNKHAIYEEAYALFVDWYGPELAAQGACLYWTQVCMKTLANHRERPVLQAGTMYWPISATGDDGGFNVFGYEWTPNEPFSQTQIKAGLLPEVHIWVALPDRGEIVDFSTAHFKEIAIRDHGLTWETEDPPLYVWGRPPRGAIYQPRIEAIKFVWLHILEKMTTPEMRAKPKEK